MNLWSVIGSAVVLAGCAQTYPHRFSSGDCVTMKLTGEEAMVIAAYQYHDTLEIRLGSGKYLTTLMVKDFELSPCDGSK